MHPCPSCDESQINAERYLGDEYFLFGIEQYERVETAQGIIWWICINENCDRFWRNTPHTENSAVNAIFQEAKEAGKDYQYTNRCVDFWRQSNREPTLQERKAILKGLTVENGDWRARVKKALDTPGSTL